MISLDGQESPNTKGAVTIRKVVGMMVQFGVSDSFDDLHIRLDNINIRLFFIYLGPTPTLT